MANPEALSLVEKWLAEVCPQTLAMKELHIIAKLAELSVWTFKDAGVAQCHPGRQFLADLVAWSVSKISRLTSKLEGWGVLRKYQPRSFDQAKQQWVPSTTVYTLPFLTRAKIRQLAWILKIDVRARMTSTSFFKKKEEENSCVQSPVRRASAPSGHVAKRAYQRLLNLGKTTATPNEPLPKMVGTHPLLRKWFARGEKTA